MPKLKSLLDRLLLGDPSMRYGNFKAPLNRPADPRIESGQIGLRCSHTLQSSTNLKNRMLTHCGSVHQGVEKQLEGEIALRSVLGTHAEQNDMAAAHLGVHQSRAPGDRRFA